MSKGEGQQRLRKPLPRIREILRVCRQSPNYVGERMESDHVILKSINGNTVTLKNDRLGNTLPKMTYANVRRQMARCGFVAETPTESRT
jgi:hypothetical protein